MDDEAETLFLELADLPPERGTRTPAANRTASVRLARITRDRLLLQSTLEGRQVQSGPLARKSAEELERFQATPTWGFSVGFTGQ